MCLSGNISVLEQEVCTRLFKVQKAWKGIQVRFVLWISLWKRKQNEIQKMSLFQILQMSNLNLGISNPSISGFQKINFTCHVIFDPMSALSFLCSGVLTRPKAMSCKWSLAMFLTRQLKSCFIQCLLISLQLGDLEGNRSAGFRRDENETHGVLALWILVVGRLLSYCEGNSSGAMLNFGRVKVQFSFSQWHHLLRLPESNRTGEK